MGSISSLVSICLGTLVSQIAEHTEIDEHLEEIAENLIYITPVFHYIYCN